MFCRYPSKRVTLILAFVILISYFIIVHYRINNRCVELQKGLIWREELSILERKVCEHERLAESELLDEIRAKISIYTSEYNWNATGVQKLEDLILENGGKPHRTLITANWKSSSDFLGELFSHLPGSFNYKDPLRYLNTTQVRGRPLSSTAIKILKSVFRCKSYDVALNFVREKELGYSRDFDWDLYPIWEYTGGDLKLILDPAFVEKACRLFPFQTVTETNTRLEVMKELMDDEELNLHLVLLIQDPRGVMASRWKDDLCQQNPECTRPEYLCADMISDFYAAGELLREFPGRTRVTRFEELSSNPYETIKDLLNFLRIDLKPVEAFLGGHNRVSKKAYEWKSLLDFKQVEEIELACRGAMELWGYLPAHNQTHLRSESFKPLGDISTRLRDLS